MEIPLPNAKDSHKQGYLSHQRYRDCLLSGAYLIVVPVSIQLATVASMYD